MRRRRLALHARLALLFVARSLRRRPVRYAARFTPSAGPGSIVHRPPESNEVAVAEVCSRSFANAGRPSPSGPAVDGWKAESEPSATGGGGQRTYLRALPATLALVLAVAVPVAHGQTVAVRNSQLQNLQFDVAAGLTRAQGFMTGPDAAGYTLTSIDVYLQQPSPAPDDLTVQLWSASGSEPGQPIGHLVQPEQPFDQRKEDFHRSGRHHAPRKHAVLPVHSSGHSIHAGGT